MRVDRIAYGARALGGEALDAAVAEQLVQVGLRAGRHAARAVLSDALAEIRRLRDSDLQASFERQATATRGGKGRLGDSKGAMRSPRS